MIGIGITVHGRAETAQHTINKIIEFAPLNSKIVVVDDASIIKPPFHVDYRFEENVGIAAAKNKCLELLDQCDHIFLFDDDCYPIIHGWEKYYINSGHKHLSFTFSKICTGKQNGNRLLLSRNGISTYANPCGCMCYYHKSVLDEVGGFDVAYGRYGWEHGDLSMRIYNAGLISAPFMDVNNSLQLFYSHDYYRTVTSSVPSKERAESIRNNRERYGMLGKSCQYKPYKPQKNIILSCLFTDCIDPQRNDNWSAVDAHKLGEELKSSIPDDVCFYLLKNKWRKLDNPYLAKWIAFRDYLKENTFDWVFMVDYTDVKMLNTPFGYMEKGRLYVGDEPGIISQNVWLKKYHNTSAIRPLFVNAANKTLLNAGVVGGDYNTVMEFLERMCELVGNNDVGMTDMGALNLICYKDFVNRLVNGRRVTTVFKAYDEENKQGSWFKHK